MAAKDDQVGVEQVRRTGDCRRQVPQCRVPDSRMPLDCREQLARVRLVDVDGAGERALGEERLQAAGAAA